MLCSRSRDWVQLSMTLEQLEQLTNDMKEAFEAHDYGLLNKLVVGNQNAISHLSASSDNDFNTALKSFIELYLSIQTHCQQEREFATQNLKKFNKAKKGLKQYNKASNRAR